MTSPLTPPSWSRLQHHPAETISFTQWSHVSSGCLHPRSVNTPCFCWHNGKKKHFPHHFLIMWFYFLSFCFPRWPPLSFHSRVEWYRSWTGWTRLCCAHGWVAISCFFCNTRCKNLFWYPYLIFGKKLCKKVFCVCLPSELQRVHRVWSGQHFVSDWSNWQPGCKRRAGTYWHRVQCLVSHVLSVNTSCDSRVFP